MVFDKKKTIGLQPSEETAKITNAGKIQKLKYISKKDVAKTMILS